MFFTDGVVEAVNPDGEVFGSARIDAALAGCPPTADGLLAGVLAALDAFTADTPASDDRTLVVVRRE